MRITPRAAVAVLLALGTVGLGSPAGAAPGPAAGATAGGSGPALAAVSGRTAIGPVRITLITGDTATYSRDAAGHASVTMDMGVDRDAISFRTRREDGGFYVFPDDTVAGLGSGRLDKELFNLDYLAGNGYADAQTGQVPVIVQYRGERSAAALRGTDLPAAGKPRPLRSVNGAALPIAKDRAGAFWTEVRKDIGSDARKDAGKDAGDVRAVWLDRKAKALDDTSGPQIGAPTAWAAGYDGTGTTVGIIDTGIDPAHPDLTGSVAAARNFVPAGSPGGGAADDVTDRFGHGTHVASIVAGSGAASGGRYKGVAPGARLLVAKALDDTGSGSNSTIIEAMEWQAATGHARVVNMSLGSTPTDGTDPVSQAVNDLTAEYGTLFVIAAGNSGPGSRTVAAPGAADAALTVGAVDGADRLAPFSSRGPRLGADPAVKPEITAPGVNIIAARAAGTSLGAGSSVPGGGPIDDNYTAASGTSMATPHVAAAAAILTQRHPSWTPREIKDALVGTAKDGGFAPYEQGAGRLDLGRAVTQPVFDDVATVSAGFTYPYAGHALTRQVTYRNTGDTPVTLAVSATAVRRGTTTTPAPAGLVAVSADSVTVPPGGAAPVTLTIDPARAADPGWYSGRLAAAGDGATLAVPIAFHIQAPPKTLRVRIVGDPTWTSMQMTTSLFATRVNDTDENLAGEPAVTFVGTFTRTDVPNTLETSLQLAGGGIYSLDTQLMYWNADRQIQRAVLLRPEVRLDADTTVTLDATGLVPVRVNTPRPSEAVTMNWQYTRATASGREFTSASVFSYPAVAPGGFWVTPTAGTPTVGRFTFLFTQVRIAPQVSLTLAARGHRTTLHPRYVDDRTSVPKFTGDRVAGLAGADELHAGADVRDKLVLLETGSLATYLSDLDLAVKGGAAGVLSNSYLSWVLNAPTYASHMKIPLLWLGTDEVPLVRAALAAPARPRAEIAATLTSPYEYKLNYYARGTVPGSMTFNPTARQLARVDAVYHAQYQPPAGAWGPQINSFESSHTFVPGQSLSIQGSHAFTAPATRTEYHNVTGPDVPWQRTFDFFDLAAGAERLATSDRAFPRSGTTREDWNETVLPGQVTAGPYLPDGTGLLLPCDNCRQGDLVRVRSLTALGYGQYTDAGDPSHGVRPGPSQEQTHLYRDGTELTPEYDSYGLPFYRVPAKAAGYRLTNEFREGFPGPHTGTTVSTTWTFRSSRPSTSTVAEPYACLDGALFNNPDPCTWLPVLQPRYRLDLPAGDTLAAGGAHDFDLSVQRGPAAVKLAGLRVWISPDGGRHWKTARVRSVRGGYRIRVDNPGRPAGTVWLRIKAWDGAGNAVEQTIADAYRLG